MKEVAQAIANLASRQEKKYNREIYDLRRKREKLQVTLRKKETALSKFTRGRALKAEKKLPKMYAEIEDLKRQINEISAKIDPSVPVKATTIPTPLPVPSKINVAAETPPPKKKQWGFPIILLLAIGVGLFISKT